MMSVAFRLSRMVHFDCWVEVRAVVHLDPRDIDMLQLRAMEVGSACDKCSGDNVFWPVSVKVGIQTPSPSDLLGWVAAVK